MIRDEDERGRTEERRAIVAWLHHCMTIADEDAARAATNGNRVVADIRRHDAYEIQSLARRIEAAAHLARAGEEER
jgi:hypothetical protein